MRQLAPLSAPPIRVTFRCPSCQRQPLLAQGRSDEMIELIQKYSDSFSMFLSKICLYSWTTHTQSMFNSCGSPESRWGYVFHAFRGLMTPTGLLVVLQTLGSPHDSLGLISAEDGRLKVQDFTMFSSCG